MKRIWTLLAALLGGAMAGVVAGLLLPAEKRAQLSQLLADYLGRMCARIPDE